MALDVQCGCASKIEIVRTNSLTGEVTGVFPQSNIWTDAGLARISGYVTTTKSSPWPNSINYGSGAHVAPHNGVTALAQQVGGVTVGVNDYRPVANNSDPDFVIVTRTLTITIPARGADWNLSELGVSYDMGALDTYSLTKVGGVVAPIPVAGIEILTITYAIQIQYPKALPPQPMVVEGLPPTTGTFQIPQPVPYNWAGSDISKGEQTWRLYPGAWDGNDWGPGGIGVNFSEFVRWAEGAGNQVSQGFGGTRVAQPRFYVLLDPPITKNKTQQLDLAVQFHFTNGTYREV